MNLVVTLLIGMLSIRPTDCLSLQGCGKGATSIRGRIVGGKLSSPGMWPWQVGIHKQSIFDSSRYSIICGGALIAPQWVLTAAHCFYERRTIGSKVWFEEDTTSLKKYKIIAGDINTQIREISEQEKFPIEVYIHPGYRHDPYYENDIALVKLNQTVTLSSLVRTVCLPINNVDFAKPGTLGTVAGWGRTRKSRISTVLAHTTIAIKDNGICKQETTYFFNKTVTFCAGDGNGRNDTCQGDSGGSLVRSVSVNGQRRWVAVGLISWGEGCGLPGKYGYYTRVHSFVGWIKDTISYSLSSCGNPGNIPFGRLIKAHRMKRFPMDFRVKYKCIDGYVLKGKSGRKCKGEGRWTSPPVCVREISCPDPGHPHNGSRRPSRGNYRYKEKIQFYCNRNHVMIGRSSLTCQIDGTWNGYPPLCLASCPDPGVPKHGVRLGNNFKHGQTVRFVCENNSKMNGSSLIICFNGTWIGDTPKCFKEGCTKPRHSPNGYVSPSKGVYYDSERVQLYCNWDYVRVGDSSLGCRNGKWNNDPPSCKRKCNNPGSPYYGWKNGNKFFEDKQVSFRCTDGYDVIGLSIIQCLDTGRWSGSVPECKRRCSYRRPSNSKPSSNTTHGRSLKHGTTIDHSCTNGYTLVGQKTIRCNDGRWSPSIPRCKAPCSDPGLISNGYQIGKTFSHHSILKYGCNNGYTLDSPGQLICDDGLWSRSVPSCKKLCDAPVTPQNGRRNGNNFKHGSQVSYRCYKNTKLVGSSRASCTNGKWSSQPPKCLEICSNLQGLANGNINRPNMKPLSGDKVTFSCNPHYDLVGNKAIFCDRGTWNGTVPQCVGNCRDVGKIRNAVVTKIKNRQGISRINGVVYKHGDRITIQCKDGFRVKGNPVLECKNGRWSDNKPSCIGVCRSLKAPQHGELRDFIFDYGSTVRFRCHHGYTLLKDQKIICNNGKWSNKEPVCKADCQDPGTPVNGQRQGHLFSHLQTVRFSCDKEFIMFGASSIQCRDGNWTRNKPVCAECGSPLGMENWEIPDENIQASSKLSWQYDAVYGRLNGRSSWCSSLIDRTPYLEIDLGKPYRITYLATQGGVRKWVSKYSVSHNLARSTFLKYRESSKEKLFIGNTDGTSIVKQKLKKPFIARKIKFHPIGVPLFGRAFNSSCMRVELYGCGLPNDCVMVGSRVLGRWVNYYHGGYIYYKAIVRTIDNNSAQLEIEDGNHDDDNFRSILKRNIVLDVPNKPINLTSGTRVLLPDRSYKYYTGTIGSGLHQDYYLVYPDYNKRRSVWRKKNEIRVLKPEEFCE